MSIGDEDDEAIRSVDTSKMSEQELLPPASHDPTPNDTSSHNGPCTHRAGRRQGHESSYMDALKVAHEAMLQELADPDVSTDEVVAAQELLYLMGGMLNDKLKSRLRSRTQAG